ncbi:importin-9-like [Gigantopelta aegis]|uniref:importin-9-like n=1 Tax=Gigantopelta aegis TaxID=1735272 RepID=UPI001B88E490|nr:importin-9-like [Gigantopelta aegis]
MAGVGDRNRSLKEVLLESLTAILSPEHAIRTAGENQIKVLEVTEEFGVHLAEITIDTCGLLAVRQLASVLLKQYVEAHWSQHSDKFRSPETIDAAKQHIRELLPQGLYESVSKVRTSIAYAMSAIAHWDWPEVWPDLFDILMQALTSGNTNAVHGAMRVLSEFCQDVTDTQITHVAPIILPEMYKIFIAADTFGIRTRGRAVHIFNICAGMIATMSELQKGVAKQLLFPILPQFTEALVQGLQMPDGHTSDSGLKMEIVKSITTVVKSFPKTMGQYLPQILPSIWTIFTQSSDVYIRTVVNNTDEADDPVDSDGDILGFENLVYSVFEFVHALIESSKFRSTVKKTVDQILYYVISYMQMTEDQIQMWTTNPDQFVEDEDDDSFSYSVRISAQDLLLSLASEFRNDTAPALCQAITKHLQEAETSKTVGNIHWWKLHESCMLALGSVRHMVLEAIQTGKVQFDVSAFLESVVLVDMNSNVSPFLIGRCLWVSSRFVDVMSPDFTQRFLQATVGGLHPTQPPMIRISAVRSVFGFCDHLKTSNNTQLLVPFLSNILDGLITIATQFSAEVLGLCIETLTVVISVDPTFTASHESKLSPLAIAVFLKHCGDPFIVSLVQDVFKVLASNEACSALLEQKLVPTLVSILRAPSDKVLPGMTSVVLDVLTTLVRCSKGHISVYLLNAFPVAVDCIMKTDDNSTIQSGGECLRAYTSVGLEQIITWQDDHDKNGLFYIIQVICKILDPKTSEYTASFVGRLVSVVISKVGTQLGENLDLILRAVLSKMQQAETLSVMQSLVMVFAHLINTQLEAVLDFLTSVPGPTGKSALEFVLAEWCSRQHLFYGSYERKISAVALCKLLQHVVATNDPRLQDITVKGEQIFQQNGGTRTRSKTSQVPDQWTNIPVMVKVYKLLINELSNQIEATLSKETEDDLEDEGWDEEEDDNDDDVAVLGQPLSSLLDDFVGDYQGFAMDEDEEDDDPDALSDPINQINLQAYLTEFLQSLSQQPCFSMFQAHHNDSERHVLQSINIQV